MEPSLNPDAAPDAPVAPTATTVAPTATTVAPTAAPKIPPTVFVWLLLLVLTYVAAPALSGRVKDKTPLKSADSLSTQEFGLYTQAELSARVGLGPQAGAQSLKSLQTARDNYRKLADSTQVPNMARRVLILDHAAGKPLDEKLLQSGVEANIPDRAEATREVALWRGLYGKGPAPAVAPAEARIRAMHLRFLEARALADLYNATGNKQKAAAQDALVSGNSTRFILRLGGLFLVGGLAGLTGVGLLIYFVIAAAQKAWWRVGRVSTAPQPVGFGPLIDAFVFYLAFSRVAALLIGLLLSRTGPPGGIAPLRFELCLHLLIQFGGGGAAVAYTLWRVRQGGGSLRDLGLTRRGQGLFRQIAYGVGGYCAGLPLFFGAAMLANLLFKNSTSTAPNPVLPLMIGSNAALDRGLIFLMASVGAPLFEEFFFRGVLLSGFRKRYGWVISSLLSSACFALVHPVSDWLPIVTLGFTFATMREMRQSLIPGMVGHFLQNTFAFLAETSLFGS